jgi:hypothetical protein
MERLEICWSELFGDEDVDAEYDHTRREEPPWFGFVPRVLAVDAACPAKPAFALWRSGEVADAGIFNVKRTEPPGKLRALLMLAETFADFCRERNLFGAYLATFDPLADAARAAVTATLAREADWCGMLILEPLPYPPEPALEAAAWLAEIAAARLDAGILKPPHLVARRPRPDKPQGLNLTLKGAGIPIGQRGGELEEDELD